jgi:hypothetical protein
VNRTLLAAVFLAAAALAMAAEIGGRKPQYLSGTARSFANSEAVTPGFFAPGLDEGYMPQGLVVTEGAIYVTGYREGGSPACRLFRIDPATGDETGAFDLPAECGHAGGLANVGGGRLVVADTRHLWSIEIAKAFDASRSKDAVRATLALGGNLYGSFAAFDGTDLWIGRYTVQKDAPLAKIHRLPLKLLSERNGGTIDERHVAETLPAPALGQGMAFESVSVLWIASSSSQIGWLHRIDRATGRVLARYDTVTGIEGIDFAGAALWAVSEAGAKKYQHWKQHFPLVFQVDTAKLR